MATSPTSRSNQSLQDSVEDLKLKVAVIASEMIIDRARAAEDREQQELDRQAAEKRYASKEKFDLLARLVYGALGIVGAGILGAAVNSLLHVAPK